MVIKYNDIWTLQSGTLALFGITDINPGHVLSNPRQNLTLNWAVRGKKELNQHLFHSMNIQKGASVGVKAITVSTGRGGTAKLGVCVHVLVI